MTSPRLLLRHLLVAQMLVGQLIAGLGVVPFIPFLFPVATPISQRVLAQLTVIPSAIKLVANSKSMTSPHRLLPRLWVAQMLVEQQIVGQAVENSIQYLFRDIMRILLQTVTPQTVVPSTIKSAV